jgi:3-hydroxyacyl-[acyl-carrier-protein] dehydratase
MRFELIDTVLERSEDRLVGIKAVTAAEEYLADHFPTFAVLPGVLMLEAMVQAARKLLGEGPEGRPWVLAEVRNVRYGNMVRPGQQLRVEVQLIKSDEATRTFQGRGTVDGEVAVQGRFTLRPRQDARPVEH